jgi:hypothetical protein
MAEETTTTYRNNRVVGAKGKHADESYLYDDGKKKKKGPAVGEAEVKATEPMPKQTDYATTAEFGEAMRKWRDRQRSAAEAADALGAKKKK